MQKIVCRSYCFTISINEVHQNSEKSLQNTNWLVNAPIEFPRSIKTDTNTGPNEIVLMTGS